MRKAIFAAFVVLLSSVGMLFGDEVLYLNIVSNAEASVIVCVPDAQVCGAVWQSSEALSPQASPEIPTVYASEFLPSPTYPHIITPHESSVDPNIYIEFVGCVGKFFTE